MTIIEALVQLRNDLKLWVTNNLRTKVDKEDGKGLSSNDFTTEEKNKLARLSTDGLASTTYVDEQLDGKSDSGHTHNYAGSSSVGGAATSADKVNKTLLIQLNGGSTEDVNKFTFNGSAAKGINITSGAIGAAAASHASQHKAGGADPITPADIGAQEAIPVTTNVPEDSDLWIDPSEEPDDMFYTKGESDTKFAEKTHASQHKTGGADPITPKDIGAVAWDNRSSLVSVDILEWALEQTNPVIIGVGSNVTNMPTNGTWWTVELNIAGNSSWRTLIAWQAIAANIVKYERRHINGTWGVWKQIATTDYAVPLDGSKSMTGALNFQTVNNGSGRVQKSHSATADYGTIIRDYDKNGNFLSVVIRAALGTVSVAGSDGVAKEILHTGNKPSGSYTGNGSSAYRSVALGGIGRLCLITRGGNHWALVSARGAIISDGSNVTAVNNTIFDGANNLQLSTSHAALNENGVTYNYQVI